jgi:hypothetical protein
MMKLRSVLACVSIALLSCVHYTVAADSEEPATPVCRAFTKNSLAFCSMVDYHAVVDDDDPYGAAFDAKARAYYENVNIVLHRFGCNSNTRYSLYSCDHCRDAYKYWVCSIKFQRCGVSRPGDNSAGQTHHHALCPYSLAARGFTPPSDCVEGVTGRFRTCLSLCEDVVRKCPYVLGFQCPTVRSALRRSRVLVTDEFIRLMIDRDDVLLD